jgi:four helix bundle protein
MVTGNKRQVTGYNPLGLHPTYRNQAGYKKLFAWQKADELAHKVYDFTIEFPKEELFSLTSQIRRAALSVAANILEGHARNNKNEFRRFLSIALGSLAEVEYYLEFSLERKYINKRQFNELNTLRESCGKLLWKLYKSQ